MHLRLQIDPADQSSLFDLLREAIPFYEQPGGIRIRLLRSRDAPERYIEVVEYASALAYDQDQQRVSSDQRMASYLKRWRALFAGPLEVETYEDVTALLFEKGGTA